MPTYFYEYRGNKTQEKFLRNYLLQNSDTLRLTNHLFSEVRLFRIKRYGTRSDQWLTKTLALLQPYFQKKVINNRLYNDIPQRQGAKYHHYFFNLAKPVKKMLMFQGLFWGVHASPFYTLEDPAFYKNNKLVGGAVSHEGYIYLNLSEPERRKIEKKVPLMK